MHRSMRMNSDWNSLRSHRLRWPEKQVESPPVSSLALQKTTTILPPRARPPKPKPSPSPVGHTDLQTSLLLLEAASSPQLHSFFPGACMQAGSRQANSLTQILTTHSILHTQCPSSAQRCSRPAWPLLTLRSFPRTKQAMMNHALLSSLLRPLNLPLHLLVVSHSCHLPTRRNTLYLEPSSGHT